MLAQQRSSLHPAHSQPRQRHLALPGLLSPAWSVLLPQPSTTSRLWGPSCFAGRGGCGPTLEVETSAQTAVQPATQPAIPEQVLQPGLPAAALALACCLATSVADFAAPLSAHASEGTLTGQSLQLFTQFLDQVESMGPAGAVLFVVVVMLFEMVPLFPTQPLSLASGLLFGAQKGALLMLLGVTLAATNAFLISQGVGRSLAQKVIDAEVDHAGSEEKGAIAKTLADVQAAIDGGGIVQQMTAVTLLRLTPVVPFSASNYLLGLTPLQLPAFLGGTILGMSVWSVLYASLGGASRALLDNGGDMEVLFQDLAEKASALSSNALGITAGLGGVIALVFAVRSLLNQQQQQQQEQQEEESARATVQGRLSSRASRGTVNGKDAGDEEEDRHNKNQTWSVTRSGEKEAVGSMVGRSAPHRSARD